MTFSISRSSISFNSAALISPRSRFARAALSAAGRNRLPTWSARNGGLLRGIHSACSFRGGERLRLALQHEVVAHLEERRGERLARRRFAGRLLDKIDDQRLLHRIDHVGVDVFVAAA